MNTLISKSSRGPYIHTSSGIKFYPFDPRPEEIEPIDIINGLANKCRFSGQVFKFYSILDHSVRVKLVVANRIDQEETLIYPTYLLLAAALHDAHEAYLADIPTPIKPFIPGWRDVEANIQAAIHIRFGLPIMLHSDHAALIKTADHILVRLEADELFVPSVADSLKAEFDDRGMPHPSFSDRAAARSDLSESSYRSIFNMTKEAVMDDMKNMLGAA